MTKMSETAISPAHLHEDDLQAMADAQEAEALLFQYIITSAGQLETPPFILKKLAANLGDPQRLPAAKLLQTTMGHPLSHPLTTLIAIEGLLEGTFEDSAEAFEQELSSFERAEQSSQPWISITYEDRRDETIPDTIISDTPLTSDPLIDRKPQKLFPAGRILLLSIAILYGVLVYKTGQFSPPAIMETLKEQRAASVHPTKNTEMHPQAPARAIAKPPQESSLPTQESTQTPREGNNPSSSATTPEALEPDGHLAGDNSTLHGARNFHEPQQTTSLPPEGVNRSKMGSTPNTAPQPEHLQHHPGVISLPDE